MAISFDCAPFFFAFKNRFFPQTQIANPNCKPNLKIDEKIIQVKQMDQKRSKGGLADKLPDEIWIVIFSWMEYVPETKSNLSQVSRRFERIADSNAYYTQLWIDYAKNNAHFKDDKITMKSLWMDMKFNHYIHEFQMNRKDAEIAMLAWNQPLTLLMDEEEPSSEDEPV
jgi:hypothetical protein